MGEVAHTSESGSVIRLDHVQQEALLSDTEACKGLVEVAGVQGGTVEMHNTASIVNAVCLKAGAERGVFVDDNGFALYVVTYSYLNHYVFSFDS